MFAAGTGTVDKLSILNILCLIDSRFEMEEVGFDFRTFENSNMQRTRHLEFAAAAGVSKVVVGWFDSKEANTMRFKVVVDKANFAAEGNMVELK